MTETVSKEIGSDLKKQAEIFEICQAEVLRRWETGTDRLGRSTAWKAEAAKDDIKNRVTDSSIMDSLAKEVVTLVDKYF